MNLKERLPNGFKVRGLNVLINTSTSFWIGTIVALEDGLLDSVSLAENAVLRIIRGESEHSLHTCNPDEIKAIYERLLWFMDGGAEKQTASDSSETRTSEKLVDYRKDLDAIYAAFVQSYGLDLYELKRVENGRNVYLIDDMHFWKFKALMQNLPSGSRLSDYYMHYRAINTSGLPSKTPEERKYKSEIERIKNAVSLSPLEKGIKVAPRVTNMDIIARRMRENK